MEIMEIRWEDGYEISVRIDGEMVIVSANREGLQSLAMQLADLAEEQPGAHIHLDRYNSLEDGSAELIIELTE
jgi:hypothetical protein